MILRSTKALAKTILPILPLLLAVCSPPVYYVRPPDWRNLKIRDRVIEHYGGVYQDYTIFLDPGHGGDDRFNEGPSGEKEADVNLRVALHLRDFMTSAGAKVIMSRTSDSTVALRERSRMAIESGVDIFISIHHNSAGDQFTNYTSTFYHALESDTDYHPSNHDIARYIQRDLSYALGNSGPLGSFDGTLSDYIIYPLSGFSVLRHTTMPAVLVEGAFFSSEYEERRLRIEQFNEIEAWGIFRGLGRYLEAGMPELVYLPSREDTSYRPTLRVRTADSSGIDWKTLTVKIDGKDAPFSVDRDSGVITCLPVEDLANGDHRLEVILRNGNGNSSLPFEPRFAVRPKPAQLSVKVHPKAVPPHRNAVSHIVVEALDRKGQAVADSTPVQLFASGGIVPSVVFTRDGLARTYVRAPGEEDPGVITASSDGIVSTDTVQFVREESSYLTGTVRSASDDRPISNAHLVVRCVDASGEAPDSISTLHEGRFIWKGRHCDTVDVEVRSDGYYGESAPLELSQIANERTIRLKSVAGEALFDKIFLIDPRYGGTETGEIGSDGLRASDANLGVARYLYRLLKASGANVHLLRSGDETIAQADRVLFSGQFRGGFYIRIDASAQTGAAGCIIYRSLTNTRLAQAIMRGLAATIELDTTGVVGSNERFYNDVAIGTVTVVLPSVRSDFFGRDNRKFMESSLAWGIYRGILIDAGYEAHPVREEIILDPVTNSPAAGKEVVLDFALVAVTDDRGVVRFYDVEGLEGKLRTVDEGSF